MKRFLLTSVLALLATFIAAGSAFAAGGPCPTASTYMNPNGTGAPGTLSSFGITSCFFIDFTSGADTNNGTSETTPWKHAPGMGGCSGTCSSTTPAAGNGFIFKGGVTWDSTTQPWTWGWSGNSSNPIYIGYDPAWFSGGSWTRPILSGSGVLSTQFSTNAAFLNFENFEFTGMFNNQTGSPNVYSFSNTGGGSRGINLYNCYFHGANVAHDGAHSSHFVSWGTSGNDSTSLFHHNAIDNSDICKIPNGYTGGSGFTCTMTGLEGGPRQIFMNYFGYMGGSSLVVDNPVDFHNNIIEWQTLSPDNGTDHENMYESNGETGSGAVIYNNVVRHGYNVGVVDFQSGPNTGITTYIFNNVLPDMDGGNMQQTYEGSSSVGTDYWFNNTAEAGRDSGNPGGVCGRDTGSATAHVINQHCITTSTSGWWQGSMNASTNLAQSKATANGQGYSLAGTPYSFQPTSGSGSTVGLGTNESSLCSAIGSGATVVSTVNSEAQAACMQDTSYGVTYDTTSHSITGVGRSSTNARPASGAWDIGAYQFNSSQSTQPNPPTGVKAVAQ